MAIYLNTAPASPAIVGLGDAALNNERSRLFRYWASSSAALRQGFKEVYKDLESQILPHMFDENNTVLLGAHRAAVRERLRRDLAVALTVTEESIEQSVSVAIARAQRSHVSFLQRAGARIPTNAQLAAIRSSVLRGLNREYPPGSGITFRDRIVRLNNNHYNQLHRIVGDAHLAGNARNRVLRNAHSALLYEGPGNTPVRGGSLYRQSRRLLVAEQTRAANEVEIETARIAGVEYAYWRLSAMHKWYGGTEICEVMANTINYDVGFELAKSGVTISPVRLRGLYRLDRWPQYPHPFCKCHSEPLFL